VSSISKYASKAHKSIARAIGCALVLGERQSWLNLTLLLRASLTASERAALAFAAMTSLDTNQRVMVAESTIKDRSIGAPLPTFLEVHEDAKWWASCATEQEREVYLLACWNSLSNSRQQSFKHYINKRNAA
jgi:hypothetical protein